MEWGYEVLILISIICSSGNLTVSDFKVIFGEPLLGLSNFCFVFEIVPLLKDAKIFNSIAETLERTSAVEGIVEVNLLLLVARVGKRFHKAEGLMPGDRLYLDEIVMEEGTDLVLFPVVILADFFFGDFVLCKHEFALDKGKFAHGKINEMG